MPFKDIATSDTLFMREVPAADDTEGRLALKRLQDVNVGVMAPIAALKVRVSLCVCAVLCAGVSSSLTGQ